MNSDRYSAIESNCDKKRRLFIEQVKLLDTFLGTGAITRAQYNKSLGDLIVKMDMKEEYENFLRENSKEA